MSHSPRMSCRVFAQPSTSERRRASDARGLTRSSKAVMFLLITKGAPMPWLRVLASRIRGLFLKRRLDREFDQELRTHIETLTEGNDRKGMTPEEWVHAAPRTLDGLEQVKQIHREQRGVLVVDTLIRDARYALRTLGRNPSFTIIAVLTLAVGMGVNTAIFSAYN